MALARGFLVCLKGVKPMYDKARDKARKHAERIAKVFSFLKEQMPEPGTDLLPVKTGVIARDTGLSPLSVRESLMIMLEKEYIAIESGDNTLYVTILRIPKKYS